MEPLHIAISGIIGVGKTTLAEKLATLLNLPVYHEPVTDNKYLDDFYKDMKTNSFPLEVYLLIERFKQHQQLVWSNSGGVQDRSIYEDTIFAKMLCDNGLMRQQDYDTYMSLFNTMSRFMCRPNLIIHLDVDPEESLRRVRMRGRECEENMTLEYLTSLRDYYDEFLNEISKSVRVIRIDWNDMNTSVEKIAQLVTEEHDERMITSVVIGE